MIRNIWIDVSCEKATVHDPLIGFDLNKAVCSTFRPRKIVWGQRFHHIENAVMERRYWLSIGLCILSFCLQVITSVVGVPAELSRVTSRLERLKTKGLY